MKREALAMSLDLYSLWFITSYVTVRLFAYSLNESGVLLGYCSQDSDDSCFGAIGSWNEPKHKIEGASRNIPFETSLLLELLETFDARVRNESLYCPCVLLPLSKK